MNEIFIGKCKLKTLKKYLLTFFNEGIKCDEFDLSE